MMYNIKGLTLMMFIGMSLSVPIAILVPAAFAGDVIIIANKSVHENSLTSKEIKNIFLIITLLGEACGTCIPKSVIIKNF